MRDGGLRTEFRNRFFGWQWTSIETFTQPGVPDSEYCSPDGDQGWIEFKRTVGWAVTFEPFQPAWIDRRARYGGRVWIAVRRVPSAKRWAGMNQLWLIPGKMVLDLAHQGLKPFGEEHMMGALGPASWNWGLIEAKLRMQPPGPARLLGGLEAGRVPDGALTAH